MYIKMYKCEKWYEKKLTFLDSVLSFLETNVELKAQIHLLQVHRNETDLCKAVTKALKSNVKPNGAGESIGSMAHLKFIPEGIGMDFYIYEGSQTEPPCMPQNWLISKTKFKVLASQVWQKKSLYPTFGLSLFFFYLDWGAETNPRYPWQSHSQQCQRWPNFMTA